MNRNLIFFAASGAFLFATLNFANAQDRPKAKLYDELGESTCGHVQALSDGFAQTIDGRTGSTAHVVINPRRGAMRNAEWRRRHIAVSFEHFKIEDRVTFYLGDAMGSIRTLFWILPAGADLLNLSAIKWNEPERDLTKPFIAGYADEPSVCGTFSPRKFAQLLTSNPTARAHIVITGPTRQERLSFAEYWLEEFEENHRIDRKRFRFFYLARNPIATAEFWFVPRKSGESKKR